MTGVALVVVLAGLVVSFGLLLRRCFRGSSAAAPQAPAHVHQFGQWDLAEAKTLLGSAMYQARRCTTCGYLDLAELRARQLGRDE